MSLQLREQRRVLLSLVVVVFLLILMSLCVFLSSHAT
jgi:hypothetical protein